MLKQPAHNEMAIFPPACSSAVNHLHICIGWVYASGRIQNVNHRRPWVRSTVGNTTDLIPVQTDTTTMLQKAPATNTAL